MFDIGLNKYLQPEVLNYLSCFVNVFFKEMTSQTLHLFFTPFGLKKNILRVVNKEGADYYVKCLNINNFVPKIFKCAWDNFTMMSMFKYNLLTFEFGQTETFAGK